jgi:hypothetical protein
MARKEPRWVVAFLRALERTGEARSAAADAGIDHTTAYARRKAHGEFADRWAGALRAHAEAKARAEAEEIAALEKGSSHPSPSHSFAAGPSLSPQGRGTELMVSGGKVRRAGHDRWSRRKEAIFFDELAATANATMAAKAAGVSTNAVHARRLKHPLFAAKWEAVVRSSSAAIDLYLVEETRKTFDPESLDTGDVKPRVTIDQAIKISQLNASKKAKALPDPFAEQAASPSAETIEALRERILKKFERLAERGRRERIEAGWSYDERHDAMVPPGWVKREA